MPESENDSRNANPSKTKMYITRTWFGFGFLVFRLVYCSDFEFELVSLQGSLDFFTFKCNQESQNQVPAKFLEFSTDFFPSYVHRIVCFLG